MIGCLLSLLTFPGVIVHELGHLIFCRLFGVPVAKVCLFRFGNPAGYVLHAEPENAVQHLFISFGPFFANTVLGAAAAAPVTIPLRVTVHPPPLREKKSFKKIATHKHNHQGNVPRGVESSCL